MTTINNKMDIQSPTTLSNLLLKARSYLASFHDTPAIDSELLLAYVLKQSRTYLYTHADSMISHNHLQHFIALLEKRREGQPIAYLIGKRDFWTLSLAVSQDTLIPRPETELLVERALVHLKDKSHARVLDLGTGSGAIALSIAKARPDCHITAVDISEKALHIAKQNAANHHLSNVHFYQSDWFSNLPRDKIFDLIISNPPYLAENDPHLTQGDLRFEPHCALVSGETGLEAIIHLIQASKFYLTEKGWLCFEHGYMQKQKIHVILEQFDYSTMQTFTDHQGHDRVTEACIHNK